MDPFVETKETIIRHELPRASWVPPRDVFTVMGKAALEEIRDMATEFERGTAGGSKAKETSPMNL